MKRKEIKDDAKERMTITIDVRDEGFIDEYRKQKTIMKNRGTALFSVLPQILVEGMRQYNRENEGRTKNEL
jgi:hypothetical protein